MILTFVKTELNGWFLIIKIKTIMFKMPWVDIKIKKSARRALAADRMNVLVSIRGMKYLADRWLLL